MGIYSGLNETTKPQVDKITSGQVVKTTSILEDKTTSPQADKPTKQQVEKSAEPQVEKYTTHLPKEMIKAIKKIAFESERKDYEVIVEAVGKYLKNHAKTINTGRKEKTDTGGV